MKLQIYSDLHLEYSDRHPPWVPPQTGADVVILAGDIHNGTLAIDWAEEVFRGKPVVYVPGNHEFYEADIAQAREALAARSARSPNVRVLDNGAWTYGAIRFLGSTLWTDFELFGAAEMGRAIEESLRHVTDFRLISNGNAGLFTPEHSVELHSAARDFLVDALARPHDGPTVVVTHHAPHPGSVHPRWQTTLSSAAFVSDLTPLLGRACLWVHGHTHDGFDYSVNGTRIVANPMGYRRSNWKYARTGTVAPSVEFENKDFDPALVIGV